MYVASQVFRYAAVVDDEQEKLDALNEVTEHFQAVMTLFDMTGAKGFPARSFAQAGDADFDPSHWHNSSTHAGWVWKGDTSSDEIVGHMFLYSVIAHVVPPARDAPAHPLAAVRAEAISKAQELMAVSQ